MPRYRIPGDIQRYQLGDYYTHGGWQHIVRSHFTTMLSGTNTIRPCRSIESMGLAGNPRRSQRLIPRPVTMVDYLQILPASRSSITYSSYPMTMTYRMGQMPDELTRPGSKTVRAMSKLYSPRLTVYHRSIQSGICANEHATRSTCLWSDHGLFLLFG